MKLDSSNIDILNSKCFSIHDDIFKSLVFNRDIGIIDISLQKASGDLSDYKIRYCNVIGIEMTSCDFWGRSPHVLDFEYVMYPDCKLLTTLYTMLQSPIDPRCKLSPDKNYIETIITFTSGDRLTIACESIEIEHRTGNTGDGSLC